MNKSGILARGLRFAAARTPLHSGVTSLCDSSCRFCLLPVRLRPSTRALSSLHSLRKSAGARDDHAPASEAELFFPAEASWAARSIKQVLFRKKPDLFSGTALSHFCISLHGLSYMSNSWILGKSCAACCCHHPSLTPSSSSATASTASLSTLTHATYLGLTSPPPLPAATAADTTAAAASASSCVLSCRRPPQVREPRVSVFSVTSAPYSSVSLMPSAALSAVTPAAKRPASTAHAASCFTTSTRSPSASRSLPLTPALSSSSSSIDTTAPSSAADSETEEDLQSFFARAEILAHLLHSRLALPLLYPFNSGGGLTHPLEEASTRHHTHSSPGSAPGYRSEAAGGPGSSSSSAGTPRHRYSQGDAISTEKLSQRTGVTSRWSRSAVLMGLAHITPMVLAATKVANLLKVVHALSFYTGQAAAAAAVRHEQAHQTLLLASSTQELPGVRANSGDVPAPAGEGASEGSTTLQQPVKAEQCAKQHTPAFSADRMIVSARRRKHQLMPYLPSMRSSVHFLRPQLWRVMKPGVERRTKHLGWR